MDERQPRGRSTASITGQPRGRTSRSQRHAAGPLPGPGTRREDGGQTGVPIRTRGMVRARAAQMDLRALLAKTVLPTYTGSSLMCVSALAGSSLPRR